MNGEEAHTLLCSEGYLWRSIDHGTRTADETIWLMIVEATEFAEQTKDEIPANKEWAEKNGAQMDAMFPHGLSGWCDDPDDSQALCDWAWEVVCSPPEGMVIEESGDCGMTWMYDVRSPEAAAAWDIVCEEEYA